LGLYKIRRIDIPVKQAIEAKLLEENEISGNTKLRKLYTKILNGEIRGIKGFAYDRDK
jgi:hypothetical protein